MRGLVVSAALVALSWGCGHDPAPWVEVPGRHVTLYHRPEATVCAGTVAYLDRAAAAIAQRLGASLPAPIAYHVDQDLAAVCHSQHAFGCARGIPATVWANHPTSVHELVHAIELRRTGYSPSVLMEGQAVALGESWTKRRPEHALADGELLVPGQHLSGDLYATAGDLVSYLLDRHGDAAFAAILAELAFDSSPDQVQAAFARVYGKSFTALRQERAAEPERRFPQNRLWLPECAALSPRPLPAEGGALEVDLACGTNAVGPLAGSMAVWEAFELSSAGLYDFATTTPEGGYVILHRCGGGPVVEVGPAGELRHPDATVVAFLPAGKYSVQFIAPLSDEPRSFSLRLGARAVGGEVCVNADPVEIGPEVQRLVLMSMAPSAPALPFRVPAARKVAGLPRDAGFGTGASVCTPACGNTCTTAEALRTQTLEAGVTHGLLGAFGEGAHTAGLAFQ